ncbi:hypothetical protein VB776_09430 [Arcicella sp. DC2W]|uniref:Lipoprotein n=1 Tax=Arcicella gelida TaxID=2984195 RepID=A0ABU5S3Q7_9BACT|nr:hypothetical protein [Arcicella sp. DC2W]MEA5403135.1 hypothetical protein [Arcicella sp. DC2W]
MKNKLKYFLFIITSIIFFCCSSPATKYENAVDESKTCSMIFIDKSVSVDPNKQFIYEKYNKIINQLIDENIKTKGDRVEVFFIHENTAKAKVAELIARSEMEIAEGASATDAEAQKTEFEMDISKERSIFKKVVINHLTSTNPSASKNSTDILAALPLIDHEIGKGFTVKAYFLSDMVESMKGANRRDFHQTPPVDDASAVGWAREDAASLQATLPNIGVAQIIIAKPFEPTASRKINNPAISTYWQRLFSELGVSGEVTEL